MKTRRTLTNRLALLCLAALAAAARADEPPGRTVVPGESPSAVQRLASARKLARDGQLPEAIDEYQRLLDEAGDKLARLGPQHLVQVRWLCHRDLAALPPAGLRLYRQRVDARARKWLEEGTAARDPAPLRRVVQEAFCSRPGDRALDLLGDLAFERGEFAEARRWWRRIVRPAGEAPAKGGEPDLDLLFPDPQVDVARVQAKQVLALLFQEDARENEGGRRAALEAFRQAYPTAEGALAGRTGRYADTLAALLGDLGALATPDAAWTSFAGGPSRSLVLPAESRDPNRLTRLVRRWRFDLETHERVDDAPPPPPGKVVTPSQAARSLAFHPLIVGDRVLVADARTVTAYDMHTGRADVWYDTAAQNGGLALAASLPAAPDLRHTLTVADGCVFARLGVPCVGPPGLRAENRESFLVCLSLRPAPKGERLRWQVRPDAPNAEGAVFEGAPLVADGRVYIAVTRFAAGRTVTAVHCYPAQAEGAPPLRWRQDVCETLELKPEGKRYRQHLLTLAGSNVVYCSHAGAVVAVDAATGRPVWARRYPVRAETDDAPSPRDLTPPVYADGRLFVAPADCDRLLCLDPATGQLLWQRDRVEVVQLFGVARGRLIFTTTDGIRAVGAASGDDRDGWVQPDVGRLPPFGRGFLAGDYVYWPTRQRLYVLNQADGQQPANLYPGPWQETLAGNLVYGEGCLAVADARTLTVCVPPAWLRAERRGDVEAQPQAALPHYRLALAEADAGQCGEAVAEFGRAEQLATPAEGWLPGLARRARQEVLFKEAAGESDEGHWDRAAAALRQAAVGRPVAERLEALRREANLWDAAGQPARAVAVWQGVLTDPALRAGHLRDARHNPQSAALTAAREVGRKAGGQRPAKLAPVEKAARASLAARWPPPADLTLPLLHGWQAPLPAGGRMLPIHVAAEAAVDDSTPSPVLFGRGRELVCRDAATGRVLWSGLSPFVAEWAGRHADTVLAAGPSGVACLRLEDGAALWTYPAPPRQPLRDFRLTASRLLCRLGKHLAALDVASGWVLWTAAAPSAGLGLPSPSGQFLTFQGGEDWVVAQTAGGRHWVLDSASGRLVHDLETTPEPWPRPPLALDGRHFCLVAGPGTAVVLDAAAGKELARLSLGGPTTLSGRPPLAVGSRDVLLVIADRNFGATLRRFDPLTGRALWDDERPIALDPVVPGEVTWDRNAVYVAAENSLAAYGLDNGKPLWRVPLADGRRWRLLPAGGYLLACPADVGGRGLRVEWLAGSIELAGVYPPREVPLLLCDPKTGAVVERLNLRCGRRVADESCQPGGPLLPRLALETAPPRIQISRRGLVVAVPGAVWGRRSASPE
jgi:outer membrane protein assembly factor BamB/tetratricopeptide (TPR) repeat protein